MASKIPKDYTYNGLTYKEWVEEGRALVVKQGNLTGWSNKYWVRPDGTQVELYSQKRPSTPQSVLEKGGHYDVRKTSVRENFKKTRKVNEDAWREALRKSVQKMGLGDRYEEFVKEIETGLRQWKKDIATWNRKLPGGADDPLAVTRGHIKALANGGMDLPENIIREFKYAVDGVRGNLSRIASEDSPLIARMMAGAPDNTDEWVIKRMLAESEGGDITRNQSHELREAILAAGDDTELIDDLIAKADIETRPIKPNNLLKITRGLPKIPKWARVGSALTLLGIIGDSVQAAETNKEVQEKGWGAKQYMDAASVATGFASLANPMFAGPSTVFGLTGAAMGRREDQRDLLQRQLNNPDEWMWNKENTQFVPIPQSGGDFSHSKENPVTIKPTQTATQIINQQHREFAQQMEPKTSQTMATQLGNTVEKWATNPANEVKYVYNNLSNWLQNLGNIQ